MSFSPEQLKILKSAESFADLTEEHVEQHLKHAQRVQDVNNRLLRCAIECPKYDRTPEDCKNCGNEECLKAFQDKKALDMELNK